MKNTKKKTVKKHKKINLKLPKTWLVIALILVSGGFIVVSGVSASQMNSLYPLEPANTQAQAELDALALRNTAKQNDPETIQDENKPPEQKPPEPESTQPAAVVEQQKSPVAEKKPALAQPSQQTVTPDPTPPPPSATTAETASSLAYINSLRAAVGKPALTQNSTMNGWALAHANTLASQCTLYHQTLGNFLNQNIGPVVVKSIAENVGYASTTPAVLEALKNSAGHYANMTGDYTYVGLGVVTAGGACAGYVYTTQMFAK